MDKKGQSVGIDFSIGIVIFLLILAFAVYSITDSLSKTSAFSPSLKSVAFSSSQKLINDVNWNVNKVPILVNAQEELLNQKLGFKYNFSSADPNSILIIQNEELLPFYKAGNSVVFLANLSSGKNLFELIYSENTNLDQISPSPEFEVDPIEDFFNYPVLVLSKIVLSGSEESVIVLWDSKQNSTIEQELNLKSVKYNITIPGKLNLGWRIPEKIETYVVKTPLRILDRFGDCNLTTLGVAVWL